MSEEYDYSYIRVKLRGGGFTGRFSEDYRSHIDAKAREGWRFVQAFSPAIVGYGASSYADLIFERPRRNP